MDNGEVIPGLNEPWSFMGAQLMEWCSGLMGSMIISELFLSTPAKSMPIIVAIMVGIPMILAGVRRTFPDEDRGVRNSLMDIMGASPPGLPKSSRLQPVWSGAPMKVLGEKSQFQQLGLGEMLAFKEVVFGSESSEPEE